MQPVFLEIPTKNTVWGGKRINSILSLEETLPVSEAWLLSASEEGESVAKNGSVKGLTISEIAENYGDLFFGKNFSKSRKFPFILKIADAKDWLPLGVSSKDRIFYVAEADENSKMIFGFNRDITREEFLFRANGNSLSAAVNSFSIKKGDIITVPAGVLHAIGKNTLVYEIVFSDEEFFLISDYGRVDAAGKKLITMINEAADIMCFEKSGEIYDARNDTELYPFGTVIERACGSAKMTVMDLDGTVGVCEKNSFVHISVLSGEVSLSYPSGAMNLGYGENLLVPADTTLKINGYAKLLLVALNDEV